MERPREFNPYAPPATDCAAEEPPHIDALRKRLVKVHEDCGALAVAWGILALLCLLTAALSAAWLQFAPIAVLLVIAVAFTWRIRPAGVILGLGLTFLLILGPLFLFPVLRAALGLFLCPLVFQGHRILWNVRVLRRAGVELWPEPTAPRT